MRLQWHGWKWWRSWGVLRTRRYLYLDLGPVMVQLSIRRRW
jgi:hypothetical protein